MGHGYIVRRGGDAYSNGFPEFAFSGSYAMVDEGIAADGRTQNWSIRLLTSGTLNFSDLGSGKKGIDVFCVGGGAGGATGGHEKGGGGGGFTKTTFNKQVKLDTDYPIVVGAGGPLRGNGGITTAFDMTAYGGHAPDMSESEHWGSRGGKGGSGGGTGAGGKGGSDGSNGGSGTHGAGGVGQGTTTREFGEPSAPLYSGGGGSGAGNGLAGQPGGEGGGGHGADGEGSYSADQMNGAVNTGGGGGGGAWSNDHTVGGGTGGSGIVVIRNAR